MRKKRILTTAQKAAKAERARRRRKAKGTSGALNKAGKPKPGRAKEVKAGRAKGLYGGATNQPRGTSPRTRHAARKSGPLTKASSTTDGSTKQASRGKRNKGTTTTDSQGRKYTGTNHPDPAVRQTLKSRARVLQKAKLSKDPAVRATQKSQAKQLGVTVGEARTKRAVKKSTGSKHANKGKAQKRVRSGMKKSSPASKRRRKK